MGSNEHNTNSVKETNVGSRYKDLSEIEKLNLENIKLPFIIKNKILMSPGNWNSMEYTPDEIKKAYENTDWDDKEIRALFADHEDRKSSRWVGEVLNPRMDGDSVYGDLVITNKQTAIDIAYGAKFGISPKVKGYENKEQAPGVLKDFLFKNMSVVIDPAVKTAYINNQEKEVIDDSKEIYVRPIILENNEELNKEDNKMAEEEAKKPDVSEEVKEESKEEESAPKEEVKEEKPKEEKEELSDEESKEEESEEDKPEEEPEAEEKEEEDPKEEVMSSLDYDLIAKKVAELLKGSKEKEMSEEESKEDEPEDEESKEEPEKEKEEEMSEKDDDDDDEVEEEMSEKEDKDAVITELQEQIATLKEDLSKSEYDIKEATLSLDKDREMTSDEKMMKALQEARPW